LGDAGRWKKEGGEGENEPKKGKREGNNLATVLQLRPRVTKKQGQEFTTTRGLKGGKK